MPWRDIPPAPPAACLSPSEHYLSGHSASPHSPRHTRACLLARCCPRFDTSLAPRLSSWTLLVSRRHQAAPHTTQWLDKALATIVALNNIRVWVTRHTTRLPSPPKAVLTSTMPSKAESSRASSLLHPAPQELVSGSRCYVHSSSNPHSNSEHSFLITSCTTASTVLSRPS